MFTYHTPETAPKESVAILENAQKNYGMIPNLHAILAEAPTTYEAYNWLYTKFTSETTLSPLEQQVVMMTINFENNCHYCVPAHTWIMKSAGMPEDVIASLRKGETLSDTKLEALRVFTKELWVKSGRVEEAQVIKFLDAGYTKRQSLEIMTGLATKLISNFTNALTNTDVDVPFKEFAWTAPQ